LQLIYFDEAKHDAEYPHYHLGGVCIDESHLLEIVGRVADIARKAFGTRELTRNTELHAADIVHRKANFKNWKDFDARVILLALFMEVLSLEQVQLIEIRINCAQLHDSQSPEEIGFMFLCERANDLVMAQKSLGMLIGDRESDHLADHFARTLAGYRAQGTDFAFGRDIHNLVDSVHFTQSHLSRLLQLADVYTWLLQFMHRRRGSTDLRHKAIWELINRAEINLFPKKYKVWPAPPSTALA